MVANTDIRVRQRTLSGMYDSNIRSGMETPSILSARGNDTFRVCTEEALALYIRGYCMDFRLKRIPRLYGGIAYPSNNSIQPPETVLRGP